MEQSARIAPLTRLDTPVLHKRDRIGLVGMGVALVLLPLERIILPAGLRIADFALVLVIAYGLARSWAKGQRLHFPLILPVWLILLSSFIATLVGLAHIDSLIALAQEIYLFLWFLLWVNILQTFPEQDVDGLIKFWSILACLEAVAAVMGMLRIGPSIFYTIPYSDRTITTEITRAIGTYVNSNAAAAYLSVSFFVVWATSWPFWTRGLLSGLILVGMYGTGSNGALFSTVGGVVGLVLLDALLAHPRDVKLWIAVLSLGTATVLVVLLISVLVLSLVPQLNISTTNQWLFNTLGRFSYSMSGRLEILRWAWSVYIKHPLGTGPNTFAALRVSLHNDYVAFLFERGPLGLIGWLWLVVETSLRPLGAAKKQQDRRARRKLLALGCGFLACAINAFSHEISHMRQVWMLMAFAIALSYINTASRSAAENPQVPG